MDDIFQKQNKGLEDKKSYSKPRFTSLEVLDGLLKLSKCKEYKEQTDPPLFSPEEFMFLSKLLLEKKKDLIFITMLDHLSYKYFYNMNIANTASLRRIEFFKNFIMNGGNATKSAIASGYSPKCAKQQGYRVLKWIQEQQLK